MGRGRGRGGDPVHSEAFLRTFALSAGQNPNCPHEMQAPEGTPRTLAGGTLIHLKTSVLSPGSNRTTVRAVVHLCFHQHCHLTGRLSCAPGPGFGGRSLAREDEFSALALGGSSVVARRCPLKSYG